MDRVSAAKYLQKKLEDIQLFGCADLFCGVESVALMVITQSDEFVDIQGACQQHAVDVASNAAEFVRNGAKYRFVSPVPDRGLENEAWMFSLSETLRRGFQAGCMERDCTRESPLVFIAVPTPGQMEIGTRCLDHASSGARRFRVFAYGRDGADPADD